MYPPQNCPEPSSILMPVSKMGVPPDHVISPYRNLIMVNWKGKSGDIRFDLGGCRSGSWILKLEPGWHIMLQLVCPRTGYWSDFLLATSSPPILRNWHRSLAAAEMSISPSLSPYIYAKGTHRLTEHISTNSESRRCLGVNQHGRPFPSSRQRSWCQWRPNQGSISSTFATYIT